ncbi:MAG: hypothetical protein J6R71_05375 [Bacteroidales bacterium]|nr:hypothetical protein [Bacteroidales bacterium]
MYCKNRHRLFCIIFICLSTVFSVECLQAQETQTDEAFSSAQWQAKALDCERRIYQGLPLVDEALLLMEKAECYLHLQAPEMAARSLDRIALYALNDSLRTEIFALRALCEKAVLPQIEATDSQNSKNP